MDPYRYPSAIPATPKGRRQQHPHFDRDNSSSSSSLDNHLDDGQLYSPAEVRSIDPVHFDAADAARLQPAYAPHSGPSVRGGTRRGRRTEVSIVSDPPSVPASPLGQAQESVRQFSSTSPLPRGAAAPGSPAVSVAELITRYTSKYHGGVEASLHYVLAVMNPASGETGISQVVLAGLRDELGVKRVMTLTGELFADPAPIRLLIKEQAVIYHPPGQPGRQQRGTVVVCGGDGTVSFLMTQMDLVQRELEAEFHPFLTDAERAQVRNYRDRFSSGHCLPDMTSEAAHPYFIIPALAPLPLGTGNDYSNCVGFGSGFSTSGSSCCAGLWALCGCGDSGESQVAAALMSAVSAPCVTFDRWEVSLVPLQLAQRVPRAERQASPRASVNSLGSATGAARNGNEPPWEGSGTSLATASPPASSDVPGSLSSSLAVSGNERRGTDQWNRVVRSANVANAVNLVDWEKLHATTQVSTYGLLNYFSIGYDAYVATRFDATRRAHPAVCSTRTQNKAVYVSLGIGGAMRCKKLRKLIPMICVPRPGPACMSNAAAAAAATPPSPALGHATVSSAVGNGDDGAVGHRDFIALQLPSMTKSLVVSNVSCYGAGTHPWQAQGGELYYRPVTLRNGDLVPAPVITAPNREEVPLPTPVPRPVTINDRAFEVQSMGGLLHYSSLGVGLTGAVKLIQTDELFAFVLCTPEDLQFPSGQCSAYTQIHLKDKYVSRIETDASVRASLCVQVDGEAMPSIMEPTIVHVRSQQESRILIRCRNATVVQ
ncbi:putative mitochondrial diacylglycerol kinase [Leptomonas pyrrhocoris]|uniref:diacylglycerol kinase (ATP) n=1 Tax=Leptomonas pyrrhocoris TaxID=157538 RepID=A0A0M9FXD2_LEPPY|nr:putative mitochondrial diacylglycerol kinase [Leptomonas pyrrhocoris]KPA78025.1 putative mitochondrial diacylglycerol kinase [Leptomonas pyrrhocoris]|eukprot:XP_015656464.1 putative mitochondrial diacylglycerol kinase [Leptomonas pyrrhocoris]